MGMHGEDTSPAGTGHKRKPKHLGKVAEDLEADVVDHSPPRKRARLVEDVDQAGDSASLCHDATKVAGAEDNTQELSEACLRLLV